MTFRNTIPLTGYQNDQAYPYRGEGAIAFLAGYGLTDVPTHFNDAQQEAWKIGWLDKLADTVRHTRMGSPRP